MAQNGRTRGGTFHGEVDRCRESQGWTTACSDMPEHDGNNQAEDSPKQAGSCRSTHPCQLATSGANLYLPGVWFADALTTFSGFTFVSFCFVFVFKLLLKPRPFVQSSFDMQAPRTLVFILFSFSLFGIVSFSEYLLFSSINQSKINKKSTL